MHAVAQTHNADKNLDQRCDEEVRRILAGPSPEYVGARSGSYEIHFWNKQHPGVVISGRFAQAIDGCIAIVSADLKNINAIVDLHNSLLRDLANLFTCNRDQRERVVLEKARALNGRVYDAAAQDFVERIPPYGDLRSPHLTSVARNLTQCSRSLLIHLVPLLTPMALTLPAGENSFPTNALAI
jgi:hypothetical protein